ncbi:MAG: geranylgeranyl reductase family protein [Nitrospiraceae bacterium]|nr:MAG: geranylgeranyl reductase family protein [Nitrospiraceae bacterium]
MNNSKIYDVIIVGGGPAGSTAGYILSKAGLRVLIIDKSRFPRHKLCGGCITDKTVKLLGRVFGETAEGLKKNNIINFASGRCEIFYRNKRILDKEGGTPFYFVQRYAYDDFFLGKTRQAGAHLIEGERVSSVDTERGLVRTSSGKEFASEFIIGADGINSIIRRQFPEEAFDRAAWRSGLGAALEIFISRSDLPQSMDHPALCFDYRNYGYAWAFPNKDRLVIGAGGLLRGDRKKFLLSMHDFLSVLNIKNPGPYQAKGYTFPYGNYLQKPVFRSVLLAGDAAGFADPLLGEGIFYAQRSAELASHAVLDALGGNKEKASRNIYAAERYVRLLEKDIFTEFEYALKIRDFLFKAFRTTGHFPVKLLLNLLGTKPIEAVHGSRSYNWLKRKG